MEGCIGEARVGQVPLQGAAGALRGGRACGLWPGLAPLPGTGTWPETQFATAGSTCMLLSRRLHSLALSGCSCPAATLCAYAKPRACAWPSSSLVPSCDIHRSVEVSSKYQGGSGEAGGRCLRRGIGELLQVPRA